MKASSSRTQLRHRILSAVVAAVVLASVGVGGCGGSSEPEDALDDSDSPLEPDDVSSDGNEPVGGVDPERNGGRTDISVDQVRDILGAECTGWSREGEPLPATLELVVDTSGSMNNEAPGTSRSKWEVTKEALEEVVDALPPSTHVGILFYPNKTVTSNGATPGDVNACVKTDAAVPLSPIGKDGSPQRDALGLAIDEVSVDSYTATFDAYSYALNELLRPYQGPNKSILLVTDGAPTIDAGCTWPGEPVVSGELYDGAGALAGHTDPIVDAIAGAYAEGIRTYLIGSPGSEEGVESEIDMRPWLSEAAIRGGTASPGCTVEGPEFCHFDMTQETDFAESLAKALQDIRGQVIDACTFELPDPPMGVSIAPGLTQVIVEWGDGSASLIEPDGNGDCTDGWEYDEDAETIELCPVTCEAVKQDSRARISFSFGCTQADIEGILK